jgi:hypothetical protein
LQEGKNESIQGKFHLMNNSTYKLEELTMEQPISLPMDNLLMIAKTLKVAQERKMKKMEL